MNIDNVCSTISATDSSSTELLETGFENMSFYRVNDFERYNTDSYPSEDDVIINDAMASRDKAIGFGNLFGGPEVAAMSVGPALQPLGLSVNTHLHQQKAQQLPLKRSVFDYAISKDLIDASIIKRLIAPERYFFYISYLYSHHIHLF